eukprot:g5430.t1
MDESKRVDDEKRTHIVEDAIESFSEDVEKENLCTHIDPIYWVDTLLRCVKHISDRGLDISKDWSKIDTSSSGSVVFGELKEYVEGGVKGSPLEEMLAKVKEEDFRQFFKVMSGGAHHEMSKRQFSTMISLAVEHVDREMREESQANCTEWNNKTNEADEEGEEEERDAVGRQYLIISVLGVALPDSKKASSYSTCFQFLGVDGVGRAKMIHKNEKYRRREDWCSHYNAEVLRNPMKKGDVARVLGGADHPLKGKLVKVVDSNLRSRRRFSVVQVEAIDLATGAGEEADGEEKRENIRTTVQVKNLSVEKHGSGGGGDVDMEKEDRERGEACACFVGAWMMTDDAMSSMPIGYAKVEIPLDVPDNVSFEGWVSMVPTKSSRSRGRRLPERERLDHHRSPTFVNVTPPTSTGARENDTVQTDNQTKHGDLPRPPPFYVSENLALGYLYVRAQYFDPNRACLLAMERSFCEQELRLREQEMRLHARQSHRKFKRISDLCKEHLRLAMKRKNNLQTKLEGTIQELRSNIEKLESDLTKARADADASRGIQKELNAKLESKGVDADKETRALRSTVEKLESDLTKARADADASRGIQKELNAKLESKDADAEKETRALRSTIEKLKSDLTKARADADASCARERDLIAQLKERENTSLSCQSRKERVELSPVSEDKLALALRVAKHCADEADSYKRTIASQEEEIRMLRKALGGTRRGTLSTAIEQINTPRQTISAQMTSTGRDNAKTIPVSRIHETLLHGESATNMDSSIDRLETDSTTKTLGGAMRCTVVATDDVPRAVLVTDDSTGLEKIKIGKCKSNEISNEVSNETSSFAPSSERLRDVDEKGTEDGEDNGKDNDDYDDHHRKCKSSVSSMDQASSLFLIPITASLPIDEKEEKGGAGDEKEEEEEEEEEE